MTNLKTRLGGKLRGCRAVFSYVWRFVGLIVRRERFGRQARVVMGAIILLTTGCARTKGSAVAFPTVAAARTQTSTSCRECHADVYAAWATTDHALANRVVDPQQDAAAFAAFPTGTAASTAAAIKPEFILGHLPLWQPLIPTAGGRWQPHEMAFDPAKKQWFNVFGTEQRHAGEWGHWTGRGMNWNSMCAQCHMTGYQKNYDASSDSYRSTWVEHGVGCIQCHGPTKPGHGAKDAVKEKSPAPFHGDRQKTMQTCATCHARAEQLTLDFQPGDNYHDHFRVVLPVDGTVFYPDGQQRDEDFNWTSMSLSRMGHAGVTCLDCHDPHTNKTILPVANNQLCLQCHAAPGRVQPNGTRAVPIDLLAHSHHAAGSPGNQCVMCHMPTTTYMQRASRHDHGWLKPDPLLTKELGIPNACSRCHTDKPIEWAIASADAWYGEKLNSRQRVRARAVASAQKLETGSDAALLGLLARDDIPAWRATYLALLTPYASEQGPIVEAARAALKRDDPLERAAGVRCLTGHRSAQEWVRPLLSDPVRLVRLDAAWALSSELPRESSQRKEYDRYLAVALDQPTGRLRLGQDLANRGGWVAAEKEIARAVTWDGNSAPIRSAHGTVLSQLGRDAEAAAEFQKVADQSPTNAPAALSAALAYSAAGQPHQAETAFRQALARDASADRTWYNFGLFLARERRFADAVAVLRQAEALNGATPDYPYALATVLLQTGDHDAAKQAAVRALAIAPGFLPAKKLLLAVPP